MSRLEGATSGTDGEDRASLAYPRLKLGSETGGVLGFGLSPVDCLCEGISVNKYLMTRMGVYGRD